MNKVLLVFALIALAPGYGAPPTHESEGPVLGAGDANADDISSTSTYYSIRRDSRKCASPTCGGYFVSRVNRTSTQCVGGSYAAKCYVVNVDAKALGLDAKEAAAFRNVIDAGQAVLRGSIKRGTQGLGFLVATEGYSAATAATPTGIFYRASDSVVRCLSARCKSVHEAKLNSTLSRDIAVLDLSGVGASDDQLTGAYSELAKGSLIVAGSNTSRSVLLASQFYLRARHMGVPSIYPRTD